MKRKVIKAVALTVALCICLASVFFAGCLTGEGSTKYDVVKQTKKDNYTYLNESAQAGQLVLIGDSIIEIYNTELFDGYPLKVYNRGISGDTSDRLLERFESNALAINPQKIVILIGTNDLSRKISIDSVVKNIREMIALSTKAGVEELYICSLLPVHKSINVGMVGLRSNKEIEKLNARLIELCAECQANYVDINTPLQDEDGEFDKRYTYDGLHPNAKGYAIITDALLKVL